LNLFESIRIHRTSVAPRAAKSLTEH
jgi:hypothetical protein